jgi:hypothetical protein
VNRIARYFLTCFVALTTATGGYGQPTDLVTTHGRHFKYAGQTFRFVGVNIRGLCHYGTPSLPYANSSHVTQNLDAVQAMGGKVVRIFAANRLYSNADNITRLTNVLNLMEARGLKAIVCLTDYYFGTDFHPQGDDAYYSGGLLTPAWFNGGYLTNYKPWVGAVVNALKNHNAVFAWQIGNELTAYTPPGTTSAYIVPFTQDIAAYIKSIDPWHMVSTGYLSAWHILQADTAAARALYQDPNIDFFSYHTYNGDDDLRSWTVHAGVEKPFVVDEFGWNTGPSRTASLLADLNKWYDTRLAAGVMQWGFQAQATDIGDGDNAVGMDPYAHGDYAALYNIYQTRAAALTPQPLPSIAPPQGTNAALGAAWQTSTNFSGAHAGDKALDGVVSPASKWTSANAAPPQWLAVDLGAVRNINGYVVRMAADATEDAHYDFLAYQIQTGASFGGPWTTQFTVSNPAQYGVMRSVHTSPVAARFVRLLVTNPGVDNYARLPEFEVFVGPNASVTGWEIY